MKVRAVCASTVKVPNNAPRAMHFYLNKTKTIETLISLIFNFCMLLVKKSILFMVQFLLILLICQISDMIYQK